MKHPEVAEEFSAYLKQRFCAPCKTGQGEP
jgi:hypothetical protein